MLDQEWMALILEAKQLGLTKEEIKEFLQQQVRIKRQIINIENAEKAIECH